MGGVFLGVSIKGVWKKGFASYGTQCANYVQLYLYHNSYVLGVKVWNMKMDFNTGGTWRRVGQWTLMMKSYDFFYSAKSLSGNK